MSSCRLNTRKLAAAVDRRRGAGCIDEISYREVARIIGVGPSLFTRLNDGYPPNADALVSLLMWLDPEAKLADYALDGDRAGAPQPVPRRREYEHVPVLTPQNMAGDPR